MRIAIYARISTNKLEQQNSLENQKQMFLEKILRDGNTLYETYADEISGTKFSNRPQLHAMLEAAGIDVVETIDTKILKNGNQDKRSSRKTVNYYASDRPSFFDYIYIKNTSRFSRNTLSYKIVQLLREKNVHILFFEQSIDTQNLTQDFMFQLFQVFDQNDSRDKSSKILTGYEQSFKNNVIHTNKNLYGYEYIKETNSLKQILHEANIVKRIFDLYSKNFGYRQISNILTSENLFNRKNEIFGKTTISRILDNEKYFGGNAHNKYDTGVVFAKTSYPKLNKNYKVEMNDRIDSIITKDLFDECKTIKESRRNEKSGVYTGVSKFASKIKCLKCHSVYVSDKDKHSNSILEYYRCKTKKNKGVSFCASRNIKKSELEQKLQNDIKDKRLEKAYDSALKLLIYQIQHLDVIYNADNLLKIKEYENNIEDFTKEIKDAFREYSRHKLSKEIYENIIDEDNQKILHYKTEVEKMKEPQQQRQLLLDVINIRINNITKKLKTTFTENDYLKYVSFLVSDKTIMTKYNIPEMSAETTEALKLVNKKYDLGNVL